MQMSRKNRSRILIAVSTATISLLACEPVIAIGWREILVVFFLAAIVFGPPMYRFIRKVEKLWRAEKTDRH
jgi:hypothetical protein